MLEKLITNLKNSLPEPLRKKLGGAEEIEENSEEESDSASELKRYEADDSVGEASDAEKKKKQISMIIRVIVIIAIGYFALDEFVLKKGDSGSGDSVDELLAKAPVRKRRKPVAKPAETTAADANKAATPADPNAATNPSAEGAMDTQATAQTEAAPIENVNVLDKNDPVALNPVGTTSDSSGSAPTGEITESKIVDTSVDSKIDQLVESTPAETAPPVTEETPTALSTPSTEEINIPSQPTISSKKSAEKKDTSMASKIVEEVAETPAPAYDQVGRGLVYNCKDKYWACVDKPAYVTCNKNMKWNKSNGHSAECVVQNIYSSDEDCAKIQKYNVSSSVPTTFCQN